MVQNFEKKKPKTKKIIKLTYKVYTVLEAI